MKIAMLGQKEVPSRAGGIEVAVEELAVRMVARGHEVTLYNCCRQGMRRAGKRKKNKTYKGVQICEIFVPNIRGVAAALGSVIATIRAVSKKYDCIHFHAEGSAVLSFLPHFFGIRTVVTIHGLDWQRSKWGSFAACYLKLGERVAVSSADKIIVLSRATQEYFYKTYRRETVIVPNGMEVPVLRGAEKIRKKWGLRKNEYILFVGRIVPEKGLKMLISAFLKTATEKKLVIAGGISDTRNFYRMLQRMAEADSRILFTDFAQKEELEELYSNCYFYCLPSEIEGMPISLLEAMSYGNACLCSDIPECMEVMEGNGFLFKQRDEEDLRQNLQYLCDHPETVEIMKRKMKDFSCEKYDWETITDKTLELYR